ANAFTQGGTERPIPANFGPPAQVPNAFADGNSAPVTYVAPMPQMQGTARAQPSPMDRGPVAWRPSAVAPPASGPGGTAQRMAVLRDSLLPRQRADAAEALAQHDWHKEPQVVDALLKAAKEDPAPLVRAECVRSLGRLGVNTVPVVATCEALKNDQNQ